MSPERIYTPSELQQNERELGRRITAQMKLAELLGVKESELLDWCNDNAGMFAKIEADNPGIVDKLVSGEVDDVTARFLRDQCGDYDTGKEPDDESLTRAA